MLWRVLLAALGSGVVSVRTAVLTVRRPCLSLRAGYVAQEFIDFPGYLSTSANLKFSDMGNGLEAFAKIPPLGLAQILFFIGAMESQTWVYITKDGIPAGKEPGDVAGDLWVRYSQWYYTDRNEIGSGLNAIEGNTRTELKVQLRWRF